MRTNLRVNNTTHELSADPRLTLLDALRDVLGLTGTKKGCDQGACGATAHRARSCQPSVLSRRCTRACPVTSRETFDKRSTPRR